MTRFVRIFYLALGLCLGSAVLIVTGQGFAGAGFGSSGGGASSADPTFTGIVTMPSAADPTTNADGECSFDADAWAAGRDALECFDGTASTYLVGVLVSDAPANGQVPKWNTGGTITWEADADTGGATEFDDIGDPSANGAVALVNTTHVWTSTLDSAGATILTIYNTDTDRAAATSILELKSNDIADADDIFIDVIADEDGTPTSIFKLTGTGLTLTVDLTAPNIPALVDPNVDGAALCWDDVTPDTNGCAGVTIFLGTSSTPADLRLREDTDNGTNYVSLIVAASLASDFVLTFPSATDTLVGKATTDTFTNKTLDFEGTGNNITTVFDRLVSFAVCQGSTATLGGNTITALGPTAVCITGSNGTRGAMQFPDSDGEFGVQWEEVLPAGWTGAFTVAGKWRAAATSGDVVLQLQVACTADAEVINDTFASAATTTETAKGTTLQLNDFSITATTTGCAADEHAQLRFYRQRTHASDTLTGTFDVVGPLRQTMRATR